MKVYIHTQGKHLRGQRSLVGSAKTYKEAVKMACAQYPANYALFDEHRERGAITFSFAA